MTSTKTYRQLIIESPEQVLNWAIENLVPFAHHLIQENHLEDLKFLVTTRPETLQQNTQYNESVLYSALKFENYEIARYLLQLERSQYLSFFYGFTRGGQTPLTIACDTFGCPNDIIYKLLENGPIYKITELKLAMYNALKARNVDAVKLLLDHESSLLNEKLEERSGKYLLHLVFDGKVSQEELFEYIWENHREKVDWSVIDNQQTTVFHAAMRSQLSPSKLLSCLTYFSRCFPSNVQDIKGNTLLHLAVAWNNISIVRYCCEELKISTRIKNHDNENALKAAVYRASLGQWDPFNDKISYLINLMFVPPHGTFCFEAMTDLFSLNSLHRSYRANYRLYQLLIDACFLQDDNSYKNVIKDFLMTFDNHPKSYFICSFLHDKAVVYPEHQTKRREIIYELGICVKKIIYNPHISFIPLLNVIKSLQTIPNFTIDSHEFCDYSGIIYYDLFFIQDANIFNDSRLTSKTIEFYNEFDKLNLINFDDIIDINLCKILFHQSINYEDKCKLVNSAIFRTQLHLANTIAVRPKGLLNNLYEVKDFHLVEEFLGQYDYNRVCCGKKVMSLKLMCREACRCFVLNKDLKGEQRGHVIQSLDLPKVLEFFLQFKD